MGHIRHEVKVGAPVGDVFDLACRTERHAEWDPYMDTRNFSGPIDQAGTTFDSTLRLMGQRIESKSTVVRVERPRLIHIRGKASNGSTSDWVYRFDPAGTATLCTLDIEYEPPGILAEVMDRLVYERALERAVRHMAENFAALAEEHVLQPA